MSYVLRRGVTACVVALLCSVLAVSGQTRQTIDAAIDVQLRVAGEVERELNLGAADLAKLPHRSLRAKDHGGVESTFEGVTLVDVLQSAGVKFGDGLRGKSLALYLVVEASDGYRAVFALPELDPAFTDRVILLADRRDGAKLSASEGPLRIVVQDEKRQGRWVRQVRSLIVKRA